MTAATWWLVVAAVLALAVLAAGGAGADTPLRVAHNPYANLPQFPPTMSNPDDQETVNRLFDTRSNCWRANRWLRVTVPQVMEEQAAGGVLHPDALEAKAASSARQELAGCPPGSWLDVPAGPGGATTRVAVDDVLADEAYALPI